MSLSDDPYAPQKPAPAAPAGPLARVPKAPRLPSFATEALFTTLDANDKGSLVFGCVWLGFLMFPAVIMLHSGAPSAPPPAAVLAVSPFYAVGVWILVSSYRRLRARRPTLATGTPVVGTVTNCQTTKGTTTLSWAFENEIGVTFNGSLSTRQPAVLGEHKLVPGADVVVIYDPNDPKRNVLWLE